MATLSPTLDRDLALIEFDDDLGIIEPGEIWPERFDPRPDFKFPVFCDWIGEDDKGIWTRRHPEAAFAEMPELWDIWNKWRLGWRDITPDLSAFETEVLLCLQGVESRGLKRAADGPKTQSGD